MDEINPFLTAPIPGQSLTVEPGSVPWEQPPQYVTLEEVVDFYLERLSNPEVIHEILYLASERKIPLLSIANVFVKTAVMKGYHTVDIGFLVTPILVEVMKTLAELNDVDYSVSAEDVRKKNTVSPQLIRELVKEAKTKIEQTPAAVVERKGLMSRGE